MRVMHRVRVASLATALAIALATGCAPQPTASVPAASVPAASVPAAPEATRTEASPPPSPSPSSAPTTDAERRIERIAVGGCLLDPAGGLALGDIDKLDPDLMLWIGDNVYADRMAVLGDLAGMRGLYQRLGENERFQRLAADTTFMATWDDHDYGRNDAGVEWVFKDGAQREFLRFWGEGEDDPRARQAGVYSARTFGSGDQTLQVILLDNRYHRDPYGDDPERTILGDEQWAWLRERLLEPATIRIIGSGIQVVNDYDPPNGDQWESWGDMPAERERLYALVRELGVTGTFIVSGDMHHGELSRLPDDAAGFGYPTYDLTGAGLDQFETEELPNPARIGTVLNTDRKFGFITIDWTEDPTIRLQLHDGISGAIHVEQVVRLSELAPRT